MRGCGWVNVVYLCADNIVGSISVMGVIIIYLFKHQSIISIVKRYDLYVHKLGITI
jgi:hypothetical protein